MHGRGTVKNCCELYSYCHCGCGLSAPICTRTKKTKNEYKGQYRQYISGHNSKTTGEPLEVIRPMYLFLWKIYGTWSEVARILDIPLSTIEGHIYAGKGVSKKNATRIRYVAGLHKQYPSRRYREAPPR